MHSFQQKGSAASYIIIGILLFAALVGGIFTVRHFLSGDQSTPTSQPAPAETSAPSSSSEPVQPSTPDSKQDQAQAPSSNTPQDQQSVTPAPSSTLPQTGPAETAITGIMVAILGGLMIAYLRSEYERQSL